MSAPTIRHHRERSGSRPKPIVASCAPRCNGATVMDRSRLFPAADRLPVVPSEHRSKGTAREALRGLISGTFRLALSRERRALWSAVALTTSRLYLAIDLLPAVLAKLKSSASASPPSSPCSRPPVTSRTHVRREYGANGGQILYVTYSRSTGTRCACSLSNSIARDIRA